MIIVDTDARLFNDDCSALAMLLSPGLPLDIRGILAASGNVWAVEAKAAASTVLRALGRSDIPVLIAAQMPLLHRPEMADYFGRIWGPLRYRGAFGIPVTFSGDSTQTNGLDFLARTINANPDQVEIAALGPLTNIALLLCLYPEVEHKIKRLVWMGGNLDAPGNTTPFAEFNFWFDPEAAQIVLRSRIAEKVMFGLDVCNRFVLTQDRFAQIVSRSTTITDLFRDGFGNGHPGFLNNPSASCLLWDELVSAFLISPGLVTEWKEVFLDVRSEFSSLYGSVCLLDRQLAPQATPVRVAMNMDLPRVFEVYTRLLTAQSLTPG